MKKTRNTRAPYALRITVVVSIMLLGFIFSNSCSKDEKNDPPTQNTSTEKENNIIETAQKVFTNDLTQLLESEMEQMRNQPQYDAYLDSLEFSINTLKIVAETNYSLAELKTAIGDFENDVADIYKQSNGDVSCTLLGIGLGYGKGVSLVGSLEGTLALGVGAGMELYAGGGIEFVYDFVTMERIVYILSICGYDEIPVGLGAAFSTGVGFASNFDWIIGFNLNDNLGIYQFEGASIGKHGSVTASIKKAIGIDDVGVSWARWKEIEGDCEGFSNLIDCPIDWPETGNGLYGITIGVQGGIGAGIELLAAYNEGEIGVCTFPLDNTYFDYVDNSLSRTLASIKMATEILTLNIAPGITSITSSSNIIAASAALVYGTIDPEECNVNTPPVVILKVKENEGTAETVFEFDASDSFDEESPITALMVRWDWNNDDVWDTEYSFTKQGYHQFDQSGIHTVSVEVFDGEYVSITATQVTVIDDISLGQPCPGTPTVTDLDGNVYNTVQIGDQCWMKENLNVGLRIDGEDGQTDNGTIEKYCYEDNEENCDEYGGLYQWNEMMQFVTVQGTQGICPEGWHIPTDSEFIVLTDFLGGATVAGGKIKEKGTLQAGTGLWKAPNEGATNESGFTALPGGLRHSEPIGFNLLNEFGYFWTTNEYYTIRAISRRLSHLGEGISTKDYTKENALNVRCLKN